MILIGLTLRPILLKRKSIEINLMEQIKKIDDHTIMKLLEYLDFTHANYMNNYNSLYICDAYQFSLPETFETPLLLKNIIDIIIIKKNTKIINLIGKGLIYFLTPHI